MEYIGEFAYDKVLLKDNVRLIIYGNGKMGRTLFAALENIEVLDKVDCICDANEELWGNWYNGIPIISPEEAIREKRDCHFLTVGKYAQEQIKFLQENGIKKIHILKSR